MENETFLLSFLLFLLVATLYSTVGHAGASGYIAVMGLLNFAPETIKPTSLVLNILVSAIATRQFLGKGHFDKKIFLLFIFSSMPFAFIGGMISIEPRYFKLLAGLFLLFSATMLFLRPKQRSEIINPEPISTSKGILAGAIIGLVSGIIGVGGGIFLSPLLLMSGRTSLKTTSGISALFILCNSVAALAGHYRGLQHLESNILFWILAVVAGGITGSYLGSQKLNNKLILYCLFVVLTGAGIKFVYQFF